MARYALQSATIFNGGTVTSAYFTLAGADLMGMWVPTLSSGSLIYLKGAFAAVGTTPASADFVRLQNPAGSGDWTGGPGGATPGSRAYTLQDAAFPFTHLKVETSVAQTEDLVIRIMAKFRTGAA